MTGTTTTRKPRTRKPETAVTWVQMPEAGSDAVGVFAAKVAALREALAQVQSDIPAYLDRQGMDAKHGEAAKQEATFKAAHGKRASEYDDRERERRSDWRIPDHVLDAAAREMTRTDITPDEAVWRALDRCRDAEPADARPFARAPQPPAAPPAADYVISFSKARQVAPLPALTPKEEALATDVFGPEQASEPGLQLSPVLRMEGPITGAEIARVREDGTREQGSEPAPEHGPRQDDEALDQAPRTLTDDLMGEGEK